MLYYSIAFTLVIIIGAAVPLKLVWNIADITTILMALFLLAGLVQRLKTDYFSRMRG